MSGIRRSEKEAWTSFDSHEISRMACPKRNQFYGRIRVDSGAWIDIHWRHIGKSIDESCDVKSDSTIVLVLTLHFEPFTIARYSSARPYNPIQLVFFWRAQTTFFIRRTNCDPSATSFLRQFSFSSVAFPSGSPRELFLSHVLIIFSEKMLAKRLLER